MKNKGIYVGQFSEQDITLGLDKAAVEKAKAETGLKYTNTEFVKRNGKVVAMKIWVCGMEDFKI